MFNENNYYKKIIEIIATNIREGSSTLEQALLDNKDFLNDNKVGIKGFIYDISIHF